MSDIAQRLILARVALAPHNETLWQLGLEFRSRVLCKA